MLDDERRVLSQRGVMRRLTEDPKNTGKSDAHGTAALGQYLKRLPSKFARLATRTEIVFNRPAGGVAKGRKAALSR